MLKIYCISLIVFFAGYLFGKFKIRLIFTNLKAEKNKISEDLFLGLNYHLNKQHDEIIESFVGDLKLNSNNIDANLVLGRLFRGRGEIEKAINIHQDILAQPNLTKHQSLQVRLELAHDYLKSGLLDRAESLLIDLIKHDWQNKKKSVESLLNVYEQEKEWNKAIALIKNLPHIGQDLKIRASHYYAEIADFYLQKKDYYNAKKHIKYSKDLYKNNIRSMLQVGSLEFKLNNYKSAVKVLQKIAHIKPAFIPESITLIEKSYRFIPSKNKYKGYLSYCLKRYPSLAVIMAYYNYIAIYDGKSAAFEVILDYFTDRPSLEGMAFLVNYLVQCYEYKDMHFLKIFKKTCESIISEKNVYRCCECGYEANELYWRCPRCSTWDKIEPMQNI